MNLKAIKNKVNHYHFVGFDGRYTIFENLHTRLYKDGTGKVCKVESITK